MNGGLTWGDAGPAPDGGDATTSGGSRVLP